MKTMWNFGELLLPLAARFIHKALPYTLLIAHMTMTLVR
jgi:hypothetical protein